ncbi:MAG: hypothetical protein JWQ74_1901 [Marmoricola sp.]|nr:hypothetical protein [Marmoricola sp.]
MRRSLLALAIVLSAFLAFPPAAQAHVERPSYWPKPTADCAVRPCAGGAVPTIRSLSSALITSKPGRTRVVCKTNSLALLEKSVARARAKGFSVRPSDREPLSKAAAAKLLRTNRALLKKCAYREIQPAVTASHNNDRVVVMPGVYTEPTSRSKPTYDPKCAKWHTHSDSGDPGALSHEYQLMCPNDANLVAVIGRGLGKGVAGDPDPALENRHGIPNAGACIRCNLQLEGSGVGADDVVLEAGSAKAGNGGPSAAGHKKDVGIFVDRADGFVLRNMKIRHPREHGIYVIETDGYVLDRFKTAYAGAYGVLTFVGDHGLIQNCDAYGSGDSGVYPGSGAPTLLASRDKSFYPKARVSQRLRWCDLHHNTGGFSGTNSHGTVIEKNNFYDNSLGYTTDVFTAAGHPGFPQSGNIVQDNSFYANNFNSYAKGSDVVPFIGSPVGTGLWLAGGNENVVRNNRFYDNWRRGMMLFAVPDATVCGPVLGDTKTPIPGCNVAGISTSYGNKIYGNTMGVAKNGAAKPNGQDFWWDSFVGNTGNCWWGNKAASGKKVVSTPGVLPSCSNGTKPASSFGLTNLTAEAELVACLAGYQLEGYPAGSDTICTWARTPKKPGSRAAAKENSAVAASQRRAFAQLCNSGAGGPRSCKQYTTQLVGLSLFELLTRPLPTAAPKVKPAARTTKPMSLYTCSWWRQADASQRLEMVQRISRFVGGPVEGDRTIGYGATLKDPAAVRLLDGRCSTGYAGGFALYKIYGAAAAFSAANAK